MVCKNQQKYKLYKVSPLYERWTIMLWYIGLQLVHDLSRILNFSEKSL